MLLNGLTKLINEYKEVQQQRSLQASVLSDVNQHNLLFQDPKLLCVAYSAVGKLSRCAARVV